MPDILYQWSDVVLFALFSSIAIVVSIIAIFFVRKYIHVDFRYRDNSVIANTSSFINVLYGVLAGLMALYLINNISYTVDAVEHEASALANIYRESLYLKQPTQKKIHSELVQYLQQVIEIEWPLMEAGKHVDNRGDLIIDQIYAEAYQSHDVLARDILQDIKILYVARQQRIHMSYNELSPEIWVVVILGTVLTLFINYLFGMNFYLHIFTVSVAALMAASMLFLLVTLDRPFQGNYNVEPSPFRSILVNIENNQA